MDKSLIPFFEPEGIALVGASHDPSKLGYTLAHNLVRSGYQGAVHYVNPKGGELFGQPIHQAATEIPDPVDLAVLLIPAPFVPDALRDCGKRGIPAAIIASGGFRETGEQGAALEEECLRIAKEFGMRLIGPNCIGLIDTHLPLDTTFLSTPAPNAGDIALISHSGAVCAAVIDWSKGQGFGLSRLLSLGNQVDVCETDVLEAVAADPNTKALTLYIESLRNGRHFVTKAKEVTKHKPIVALKVGRFERSQQAAASHTGALAGEEFAYDAAFERCGVIRADTMEQLFDWAKALAWCPPIKGRGVAVLTNSGGPGVIASDAIEANDLYLADFSPETNNQLEQLMPSAASIHNPVDMLAGATPELFASALECLLSDEAVHSCIVIMPPPPVSSAGAVARALIPIIQASDKPVVLVLMGHPMIQEAVEYFRDVQIPEYRFPEKAASALSKLAQRADYLESTDEQTPFPKGIDRDAAAKLLAKQSDGFLSTDVAQELIACYGIQIPGLSLATSVTEALEGGESLGYPLALKVASEEIVHKSDVGGVRINIQDAQELQLAYEEILANCARLQPNAKVQGVWVQQMAPSGHELILGSVQDAQFGPLAMFGSGGVEVEGLGDVAFGLAPLTTNDVSRLLEDTWAGRKLAGYRNIPEANRTAVEDALVRIGQLASDFPELAEIEINPLIATAFEAIAIDVRVRLDRQS